MQANAQKIANATPLDKQSDSFQHLTSDTSAKRLPHWESIFHQAHIPTYLPDVQSVLEFGPGRGLTGAILKHYGLDYSSVDVVDFGAKPDFLSSIKDFSAPRSYDLVCAFQALEHNPPEDFVPHLKKMASVSNKYVYISLPYHGRWLHCNLAINLPKILKSISFGVQWPRVFQKARPIEKYRQSENPYRHHWFEVGEKGYSKKDMVQFAKDANLKVIKDFHSKTFPYHYFLLMEKI